MEKKYGLIKASDAKKPLANFSRPSVFGDESSDEDTAPRKIGLPGEKQKQQAKLIQEKAMEEDPTIYQYDEVYDEISNKRAEEKAKKSEDKKPKYIQRLLVAAEKRKIENERRIERQVQKEREAEGEQFKDKEAFVTASYRKKLEELKKAEEEEAREAYLESIGDVRKQGNLDGFYRHIYSQKLDSKPSNEAKNSKKDDESHLIPASATQEDSENEESDPVLSKVQISKTEKRDTKSRSYRKRNNSEAQNTKESDEDEEETVATKKAHLQSNLDADSDFSIDSSSSEDEKEDEKDTIVPESAPLEFVKQTETAEKTEMGPPKAEETTKKLPEEEKKPENGHKEEKEVKPKKEKIDIWKKRTVGDAFDAALQRYYERKALREQ
ncbi:nuclear speckle splicing regulatory protein 1 [Culicoides brevitarsis]|uniref:nuclear speckle splicing regulatory protein 1 n=1 Tax=Culicoides brevitarsis TaxID=469753 RepID=UPI00307BF3E3